jgi:hypothetical protein
MGLKIAMSEKMLLEKLGTYFEKKLDEGHKWPDLFYCQWCMATLCVVYAHFFAIGLEIIPFSWDWKLLIRYPLLVCASSFLCGNAWNLYETVNRIKERNEAEAAYYNTMFEEQSEN